MSAAVLNLIGLDYLYTEMSMTLLCLFLHLLSLFSCSISYDPVREYSGSTFFDRWDFYGSWDNLTLGELV
jgi:hypothetical protein